MTASDLFFITNLMTEQKLSQYQRNKHDPDFMEKKREYSRRSYYKYREKIIASTGEYSAKRKSDIPEYAILYSARHRAKKLGLDFNLELEDIVIPEFCPILGIKIECNRGERGSKNFSPSLDRKDNSKGYIKGNVFVISYRANTLKSDMNIEQVEKLLEYMKS